MKKTVYKSLISSIVFVTGVWVFGFLSLSVFALLTKVPSGTKLTVSMWNDLVDQVFQKNGTSLYYMTGNVGVGVSSPSTKLDVNGIVQSSNSIKAYASFNGLSSVSVYDSYGIQSIVRTGVGVYKITWSKPFLNLNYLVVGSCNMRGSSGAQFGLEGNNINGSSYRGLYTDYVMVGCRDSENVNRDSDLIHIMALGQN